MCFSSVLMLPSSWSAKSRKGQPTYQQVRIFFPIYIADIAMSDGIVKESIY